MKKTILRSLIIAGSAMLCLLIATAVAAQSNSPIQWQNQKLSLQFDNAPIGTILNSVAAATGFKLDVDPSVSSFRESVSFKDVPLRDAILKILDGSEIDYVIVGDPKSSQGVTKVMLLGFAPKGSAAPSAGMGITSAELPKNPVVNPYNAATTPNNMMGVREPGQPFPPHMTSSGRFLPFPEAGANENETQPVTGPRIVPPNPFNPHPQTMTPKSPYSGPPTPNNPMTPQQQKK